MGVFSFAIRISFQGYGAVNTTLLGSERSICTI